MGNHQGCAPDIRNLQICNQDTVETQEVSSLTPCFWEKLSHGGRFQLGEEGTSVDGTEVADISLPVQLLCHDRESRSLLQIQTGRGHEVSSSQEVRHPSAHIEVCPCKDLLDVTFLRRRQNKSEQEAEKLRTVEEVN